MRQNKSCENYSEKILFWTNPFLDKSSFGQILFWTNGSSFKKAK